MSALQYRYTRSGRSVAYDDDEQNAFNYTDGDANNFAPDDDDFEPSNGFGSDGRGDPAPAGAETALPTVDRTTKNHFDIGIDVRGEFIPPDDLIDGMITRISRNGIVGASGSGKSFAIGEMAVSVTTGRPFAGHDVLRQGGFALFSYEASGSIDARWRGLSRKYDGLLTNEDGSAKVPFFPVRSPVALSSNDGWREMRDTMLRMQDVSWERFDRPLVAVAVDTVHASQMVLKENDAGEWARPLCWMTELSEEFQLAFIISHHSGKSQDNPDGKTAEGSLWRGSGAAPAALDNIVALKMDKREGKVSRRWMFLEKSKDGETGYIADIETKVHVIGRKRNGKPVTTLTLDFNRKTADDMRREQEAMKAERAAQRAADWKPSKPAKILMQAIRIVAQEEGRAVELTEGGWSYVASKHAVEEHFRKSAPGNPSRDLNSALAALTKSAGLETDEKNVTYELKCSEPIRLGPFT